MFRASSAHLQEYTVVYMQHMVLSLSIRVRGGLSVHSLGENSCFASHNLMFSDRASWIDYILITSLMHWLLFIHKILFFSTCFEPQVLIFRRIQLYTYRMWYCHCKLVSGRVLLKHDLFTRPLTCLQSDSITFCMCTTVSSWRWVLEAQNM